MKISIITVCYNSESTLEACAQSIKYQSYDDVEWVVVDGKSTDNSEAIIKKYLSEGDKYVSEKDNGIYDAMNKGVSMATGEFIGILNSDDIYAHDKVIEIVAENLQQSEADCLFANVEYVKFEDLSQRVRLVQPGPRKPFTSGWYPPHPTFFVKREHYDRFGSYNQELEVAADFELMLRFMDGRNITSVHLDEVLVKMRVGGKSNGSIRNIIQGYHNIKKAFQINNIKQPWNYFPKRYLSKVKEFI